MPVTQVSSGLILSDLLNTSSDLSSWTFSATAGSGAGIVSASDSLSSSQPLPPGQTACFAASVVAEWASEAVLAIAQAQFYKTLNIGSASGRRIHIWAAAMVGPDGQGGMNCYPVSLGSVDYPTPMGVLSCSSTTWPGMQRIDATIPDELTGNQVVCVGQFFLDQECGGQECDGACQVGCLTICLNDYLVITGLANGQVVRLYNSNKAQVAVATAKGGQVSLNLLSGNWTFPGSGYLHVTATDGVTLLDVTASETFCGGDVWAWTAPPPSLAVSTSAFIIYPSGSGDSPTSTTITATLMTPGGNAYSGQTLSFSTSLGTLSAASGTTNSSGQVAVTLSSTTPGLAVVTVSWAGNSTLPAATEYAPVHVFAQPEAPNSALPFQVFVEGIPYAFSDGFYTLAANGIVGSFEVDIPAWVSTITSMGLVSIYRWGVKEFAGVLTRIERMLSDAPTVKLKGGDASWLLNTRIIRAAFTTATTQSVLTTLLDDFPCGITVGTFNTATSATVSEDWIETQLLAAITQTIAAAAGWAFRVNPNLTMDYSNSLGVNSSAVFVEDQNIDTLSSLTIDLSIAENSIHAQGGSPLIVGLIVPPAGSYIRALGQNSASILQYGLLEGSIMDPTISDQTTLNSLASGTAASKAIAGNIIQLTVTDPYATGTYHLYDSVTVTSPTLGLSGYYQVQQITRRLTNANYAELQLSARMPEHWELDEPVKKVINKLLNA